jgi:hypothetical protein
LVRAEPRKPQLQLTEALEELLHSALYCLLLVVALEIMAVLPQQQVLEQPPVI